MPKKIDLTGLKFNHLLVIRDDGFRQGRKVYWLCECDCGNILNVRADHLKEGRMKSCGCLQYLEQDLKSHGESGLRLYKTWKNIKSRIKDKSNEAYGGKGISMCDDWYDYEKFSKWARDNGYSDELTIDRIDFNGDYSPDNCRWITIAEQQRNKSSNRVLEFRGEKKIASEWALERNINYNTLIKRLNSGWSIEDALSIK